MSQPSPDSDSGGPALTELLQGIWYPCGRADILRHVAARGAGDDVTGPLGGLPDREYPGLSAIEDELRRQRKTQS